MKLAAIEIKAFVPARDLAQSMAFYQALGFEVEWSDADMAALRLGPVAFLLQAFDHPAFIQNYQMHLLVEDVDAWHAQVLASGVVGRYGVRVDPPQDQPWGLRDFPLFDPSGVLWRVAQELPDG